MSEKRKKYDREFREGAVRIVEETGKPIAQIARDLGVNEGTLGNWVNRAREAAQGTRGLSKDDVEELKRLRAENAELRMERDVLKRSVVLWVKEAERHEALTNRAVVRGHRLRSVVAGRVKLRAAGSPGRG
jgi:transposase